MYPTFPMQQPYNPMQQQISNIQNQYQQQLAAIQQPVQPQSAPIQYVSNRQSADAYSVSPNTTVLLMDQNLPRFYIKQADASGFASVKSYDFTESKEETPKSDYVTKAEFDDLRQEIDQYKQMLSGSVATSKTADIKAEKGTK